MQNVEPEVGGNAEGQQLAQARRAGQGRSGGVSAGVRQPRGAFCGARPFTYTNEQLHNEETDGAGGRRAVDIVCLEHARERDGEERDVDEDIDHVGVEVDDLVRPPRPQHGDVDEVEKAERHDGARAEREEDDPVQQLWVGACERVRECARACVREGRLLRASAGRKERKERTRSSTARIVDAMTYGRTSGGYRSVIRNGTTPPLPLPPPSMASRR